MRRFWLLIVLLIASAMCGAQAPDPVKWVGSIEPANPHPGQKATFKLTGTIQQSWHVYSMTPVVDGPFATKVELKPSAGIGEIGKPEQPDPIKKLDQNFGKQVEYYEGSVTFSIPFRVAKEAKGVVSASATVTYQTCTDGSCLNPTPRTLTASFEATGDPVSDTSPLNAAPTVVNPPPAGDSQTSTIAKARANGLLAYLLVSIGAGFFALVTPCVFPMIPITVSFFSKKKGQTPREGLKQALWYVAGIISTFTALGIIVSIVFGAAGLQNFANNPFLNLFLTIVFVVLALSLFGYFELVLPASITNRFDGSSKTGFIGPVFMGLTFSLTSFTCTLPFVGSLLVSASQGDRLWPVIGMLGFSTAFSLPFFLLALFPQWLSRLPKSGAWLATTKAFMGFVELAAAVKFVSSFDLGIRPGGLGIITREVFLAIWVVLAVLAGCYMLGLIRLPKVDEGPKIGFIRRGVGVLTFVAAGYALIGVNGSSIGELESFLPPNPYPGHESKGPTEGGLVWLSNLEQAKAQATAEHKPIFIDFTGQFCTSCRWMEKNMFPNEQVAARLKKFVLVKLYTDRQTPADDANQNLMKELTQSVTLPTYVTLDSAGAKVGSRVFTRDTSDFVSFLDRPLGASMTASLAK